MNKIVNVMDYIPLAKNKLSQHAWDYIDGAAEGETTKLDNTSAFNKYKLIPRVLQNVSERKIATTVLGQNVSLPVLLAPTSPLKLAHEDAELAQAKAAAKAKTIAICSMDSHFSLEEIAACGEENLWFQLYCYGNRELMEQVVRTAEQCGYRALVLTVDATYPGRRERMLRTNFTMPAHIQMGNLIKLNVAKDLKREDGSVKRFPITWADLDWLQTITKMPIFLKGVLNADDAAKAVDLGVKGIIVSNHGGRQLDHVPAAIDCLEDIARRVGNKAEVLVDGGIYRGTDVLKALALGAKAALIGRAYIWGLAAAGQSGIENVLEMLRLEIDVAMMQLGISDISQVNRDILVDLSKFR